MGYDIDGDMYVFALEVRAVSERVLFDSHSAASIIVFLVTR